MAQMKQKLLMGKGFMDVANLCSSFKEIELAQEQINIELNILLLGIITIYHINLCLEKIIFGKGIVFVPSEQVTEDYDRLHSVNV